MPYNSNISRADVGALIPEDRVREIFGTIGENSMVLSLAKRLRDMQRGELRMPVLSALPVAYFAGEVGRSPQTFDGIKQTTEMAWTDKYIYAEEIAVIVPVPENVVDDMDYPIWDEVNPYIRSAIGKLVDQAILFYTSGVTAPANWPSGIMVGMPASHVVTLGSVGDLYADLLQLGGVWNLVEADGYGVTGAIGDLSMKARLRGTRDSATGLPIFYSDPKAKFPYTVDGVPMQFPMNGAWDAASALLIAGQWDQLVWSVRKDVNLKVLTEGVITDNASPRAIIYNLGQDDMIALRVTFRMGWQLPNPINPINTDAATRYPFAALAPAGSGS